MIKLGQRVLVISCDIVISQPNSTLNEATVLKLRLKTLLNYTKFLPQKLMSSPAVLCTQSKKAFKR